MTPKDQLKIIEQEAKSFFEKLGMEGAVSVEPGEEESSVTVSVRTDEPKMFIGERGQTLFEIQHILKLILRKKIEEPLYVSLDINDYKKNKEDYLRELAIDTADEVALLKKEKELPPMSPAERKVIHMALADRADVVSESAGEGENRRIVIKLAGN